MALAVNPSVDRLAAVDHAVLRGGHRRQRFCALLTPSWGIHPYHFLLRRSERRGRVSSDGTATAEQPRGATMEACSSAAGRSGWWSCGPGPGRDGSSSARLARLRPARPHRHPRQPAAVDPQPVLQPHRSTAPSPPSSQAMEDLSDYHAAAGQLPGPGRQREGRQVPALGHPGRADGVLGRRLGRRLGRLLQPRRPVDRGVGGPPVGHHLPPAADAVASPSSTSTRARSSAATGACSTAWARSSPTPPPASASCSWRPRRR